MVKCRIFIFVLSSLAVAPALADFGDIIYSWDAPRVSGESPYCRGLAWDGTYVWCSVMNYPTPPYAKVYRCCPSNGSVVASFDNPLGRDGTRGMTYRRYRGQDTLEMAGEADNLPFIFWLNFKGEVVDRRRVYIPGNVPISAICFDGRNDWVTYVISDDYSTVYKLNDGGSSIASFKMRTKGAAFGIDMQGDFFWVSVDYFGPPSFYGACKVRPNGSIVATLTEGPYSQHTYDCAYENNHLWIATDSRRIYCIDVSNAPAVEPASLGKVKALFR